MDGGAGIGLQWTMTIWSDLKAQIQQAADDFQPGTESFRWSAAGEDIAHWPESARNLVAVIEKMDALALFHGRQVQWVHAQTYITTPIHLAEWLIRAARRHQATGADFSVAALRKYVDEKVVWFHQVQPLAEVDCTENPGPFKFSNGVTFSFAGGVPNERLAYELTRTSGLALPKCETVLYTSHTHPVHHATNGDCDAPQMRSGEFDQAAQAIEDAILCLSLVTPADRGVFGMSITCVPDETVPCNETHRGWTVMPIMAPTQAVVLNHNDLGEADKLLKAFVATDAGKRKAFSVAMRHLNAFGARLPPVDRAVHLRIALEAMLVNDHNEKYQIRYRLSTRAAWLLGSTPEKRSDYRKSFKKAYDIASKAVHEGQLSRDDLAHLNEVAERTRGILRRFICDKRHPDWEQLELGGA